ncbi:MAG: dihydrofolate reductase [Bacteroidaceae bacterium]|nr:dihydrofolate reductase [Bacteroidaceae bacterium]
MISIIVAVAENGAIGYKGNLVYHLSADMKRFKSLTTGNTVLMGRKTFESLPKGALPNRRNIVLTRQQGAAYPNTEVFASIGQALEHCKSDEKVYVIGGAEIYRQSLELASELELTLVHDVPGNADTFFPDFSNDSSWQLVSREDHEPDEKNQYAYSFLTYRRV